MESSAAEVAALREKEKSYEKELERMRIDSSAKVCIFYVKGRCEVHVFYYYGLLIVLVREGEKTMICEGIPRNAGGV